MKNIRETSRQFIKKRIGVTVAMSGATETIADILPANALIFGVTVRVVTAITGATSFHVGDGIYPWRWGKNIAVAAGTVTGIDDFQLAEPQYCGPETDIVLTAVGGDFTAGAVRVECTYMQLTEPEV